MDILISRHECFKGMEYTEREGDGMVEEETDRQRQNYRLFYFIVVFRSFLSESRLTLQLSNLHWP